VSFLRDSTAFLAAALAHGNFLLLNPELDPLSESSTRLAFVPYRVVEPLIGAPYAQSEEELAAAYDSRRAAPPTLLFLGLDESDRAAGFEWARRAGASVYKGRPYFAVAVGDWTPEGVRGEWKKTTVDLKLGREHAAMLGQARAVMDWNNRNRVSAPSPGASGAGEGTD